jgi:hypothetical protein
MLKELKMKTSLFILFLTMTGLVNAQERFENIYYWKNTNKKTFHYVVLPKLVVKVDLMNAGEDEYYAMVTVKSEPVAASAEVIDKLSAGLTPMRIHTEPRSDKAMVNFVNTNVNLEFPIMNTQMGAQIHEMTFINKVTYQKIKNAKTVFATMPVSVSPLINEVVETYSLPTTTCQDLARNGKTLKAVMDNYVTLLEEIDRQNFRYLETKKLLKVALDQTCFGNLELKVKSFTELMTSVIPVKQSAVKIDAQFVRDYYKNFELDLKLQTVWE